MFVRMDLLSREDGASLLATIFMKITGHRHKVPKLSKRVLKVFVKINSCRFVYFVVNSLSIKHSHSAEKQFLGQKFLVNKNN